jgi:hypothetical protein
MVNPKYYDWSYLDRQLVMAFFEMSRNNTIEVTHTPGSLANEFRKIFNFFEVPVKVKVKRGKEVKQNEVHVGGCYYVYDDKKSKKSIEISFHFNPLTEHVTLTPKRHRRVIRTISDTVMHEIIHMRQYRRRNFKDIPGYNSTAEYARLRNKQNYLGHNDEIDAYAFNISCWLIDNFKNKKDMVEYLNKDHSDKRRMETTFVWYLKTFDHNHNHRVIKKLKKKIMYYLPYAELGKPYKTTDWLK